MTREKPQRCIVPGTKFKTDSAQRSCSCPAVAWRALVLDSFLYLIPYFSPSVSHIARPFFYCFFFASNHDTFLISFIGREGGTGGPESINCLDDHRGRYQGVGRAREGQVKRQKNTGSVERVRHELVSPLLV